MKKIRKTVLRLQTALRQNPVEMAVALLFGAIGWIQFDFPDWKGASMLAGFPLAFLSIHALNGLFAARYRWIYYASVLLAVPFLLWRPEIFSARYLVSLVVVQLLYLVASRQTDNRGFMEYGFRYVRGLSAGLLLAGTAYLLTLSLYFSVVYIFGIWEGIGSRFITYVSSTAFLVLWPWLLMMFDRPGSAGPGTSRFFDMLVNYVLTPALLLYAVILYLYCIRIGVTWSLPKGGVAYIVVGFVSAAFVLKGFQPFLSRTYYSWFYRYVPFYAVPPLVLYWIGACYRIGQYGYTELRVYLVAVGAILTGTELLFMTRRLGRYSYAAWLAVVSLAAVTYVPGITAKDIEHRSQTGRESSAEIDPEFPRYMAVEWNGPVDISGYRTFCPVAAYGDREMTLRNENDSLVLRTSEKEVLYHRALPEFWEEQCRKAGVNPNDSIPESAYPELLRLEIGTGLLLLERIGLERDTVCRVTYVSGKCYFEK